MSDLDAVIRTRLDGWTPPPSPTSDEPVFIPGADLRWTDEDVERWRELIAEAQTMPMRVLPPGPKLYPGFDEMRAALTAVLELHKPEWNGGTQICWYCREGGPGYEAEPVTYPCPTVRAIAEKLGVEVERG